MNNWKALKYLSALSLPLTALVAFQSYGWLVWLTLVYAFVIIPLLELLVRPSRHNMDEASEQIAREDPFYDLVIYAVLPVQLLLLLVFCFSIGEEGLTTAEMAGRITAMGVLCGTFGINVGHELGHRNKKHEQIIAKILLLSSLYMHFFIEHNRGHHKKVSTSEDPASARKGQTVYGFWLKSVTGSYLSAWRLEQQRLARNGQHWFSLKNEMLVFQLLQVLLVTAIWLTFSMQVALAFVLAAFIGILELETVNYIEHYGLQRAKKDSGRYERVMPWHSWNSDHVVGRLMLFELSRHSDHHFNASRKYQVLRHYDEAPQMPTGYPGMMVMALVPPIWFAVMHRQLGRFEQTRPAAA